MASLDGTILPVEPNPSGFFPKIIFLPQKGVAFSGEIGYNKGVKENAFAE
jgi:hypothetical protein